MKIKFSSSHIKLRNIKLKHKLLMLKSQYMNIAPPSQCKIIIESIKHKSFVYSKKEEKYCLPFGPRIHPGGLTDLLQKLSES